MSRSPITTHILDTAAGRPAAGVRVLLERLDPGTGKYVELGQGVTDDDGRIGDLMDAGTLQAGIHRLTFYTGDYLSDAGRPGFYPEVPVIFEIAADATDEHYHVPLLLNPFGYSTYRGS